MENTRAVCGAGFGSTPRQLRASDFGCTLPRRDALDAGTCGERQRVLIETLEAFEKASASAHYHVLAQQNLERWAREAGRSGGAAGATESRGLAEAEGRARTECTVLVRAGDWGEVTLDLTREYGVCFASLNMANAYGPGGGYAEGMVAQEENMFRRTDCHFSLERGVTMRPSDECYVASMSTLLNAEDGRVYLDVSAPRVCVRGPEDRAAADLGYEWLHEANVFPFYELRAAACDLRDGSAYDERATRHRVRAQLDTLKDAGVRHVVLSAFGCGAFRNPAERVAAAYAAELRGRASDFDVVAFAIFHAGYGPDNFAPFQRAFARWNDGGRDGDREDGVSSGGEDEPTSARKRTKRHT